MPFPSLRHLLLPALGFLPVLASAQQPELTKPSPWGDWVEKQSPFFSSVLDCRDGGEGLPKDNLTPRGLILNLGHNVWACFDTDLLRIAAIWQGEDGKPPVTAVALAPGSYHVAGQKTKDGQDFLPKPIGDIWLANGLYPGWQVGEKPTLTDPREAAPSPEEVGRGPLPVADKSLFRAVNIVSIGDTLNEESRHQAVDFTVGGTEVRATFGSSVNQWREIDVTVTCTVQPHAESLVWAIGSVDPGSKVLFAIQPGTKPDAASLQTADQLKWVKVPPSEEVASFAVRLVTSVTQLRDMASPYRQGDESPFWKEEVSVAASMESAKGPSFVLDTIPLPVPNPWKRNVRLADIDFLDDQGNAVGVTMDGDVWSISGLKDDLQNVTWKRFATGLHEPMSIVVRPTTTPGRTTSAAELESARQAIAKLVSQRKDLVAKLKDIFDNRSRGVVRCADDDHVIFRMHQELEDSLAKLIREKASADKIAQVAAKKAELGTVIDGLLKEAEDSRKLRLQFETEFAAARKAVDDVDAQRSKLAKLVIDAGPSIFVFDRSGIWKLVDTDNNGEADRYEMFCNLFAQTAETREFPNSMKLAPDGSLVISKGGQEGTTLGKDNGTVIRVAADGQSYAVIGYGLRQPFVGVNQKTGLVTASDQQGNYVPSTPLHIIESHHFYGHLPTIAPPESYPESIADPLVWIPHPVNPSGVTQVWLTDAKMGPVNDELLHIGYNRPEIFRVLMNTRFKKPQATVMSFWRDLDFGPLNGHVNPADGQLYLVGFQIWGTTAKGLSGLARLRFTGEPRVLLKECTPMDKGLLLRFNAPLDAKLAQDPASYSAERWNYKRTPDYGSPHLKPDGSPGQEWMVPSSAYLSQDGMSVFVGFPDMKPGIHQMRIGWGLKSADGHKAENTAYLTPFELATFDPEKEGFGKMTVDLTPRAAVAATEVKATVEEGQRLYQMIGCMACHSTDGSTVGKVGPSWKGIYGSDREIGKVDGKSVKKTVKVSADETYLHESIINPSAKVVKGFEKFDTGMPIYNGILNESQIQSLILYIKSLK